MDHCPRYSAAEAFRLLSEGNARFLASQSADGDVSEHRRHATASKGQFPYAVVVTCSDSRVVPEFIFSAGIGDLFVIRTAGNTIDECSLGSIEYAIRHLGVRLVVVMGHTHCGAIAAAASGIHEEHIGPITDRIRECSDGVSDVDDICHLNIQNSLREIESILPDRHDVRYVSALYDIVNGTALFHDDLDETEDDPVIDPNIYDE